MLGKVQNLLFWVNFDQRFETLKNLHFGHNFIDNFFFSQKLAKIVIFEK